MASTTEYNPQDSRNQDKAQKDPLEKAGKRGKFSRFINSRKLAQAKGYIKQAPKLDQSQPLGGSLNRSFQ